MSKKEKDKAKDKEKKYKKILLKTHKLAENCKAECCDKYKKAEDKRCKRCPMFDLFKKLNKAKKLHS